MRMEELSNGKYIKSTDTVEKYLLDLVKNYFNTNDSAPENSRENIIQKALERMKEEIDFESIGVLSIVLSDGIERTGAVSISLNDLGGEPAILPKRSAFNVNFGSSKGTACQGDDPRLSDKRYPLEHEHTIDNILGLSNELSTINGKLDRVTEHIHGNKEVLDKIIYTGNRNSIDLADIENTEKIIRDLIQEIEDEVNIYQKETSITIDNINVGIENIRNEILDIQTLIAETNQQYKLEAIQYADEQIQGVKTEINSVLDELVTRTMLADTIRTASNSYAFFDKVSVSLSDIVSRNTSLFEVPSNDIANRIKQIHGSLLLQEDVVIEVSLKAYNRTYRLPYVIFEDNDVKGLITPLVSNLKCIIKLECNKEDIPPEILKDGVITVSYYVRQAVTL